MTWDSTYPQDTIPANTLDLALRNTKLLIRERAQAWNGSLYEHSFFGASATGLHPLSQIGWVQIHSSYAAMVAGGPYNNGSLHYAIGDSLYVQDVGIMRVVSTLDHTKLIIDSTDYHTQYYLDSGARPMLTELRMDVPIVEATPQTGNANPMPASHDALSWYDGHGVDGELLVGRHFVDGTQGMATGDIDLGGSETNSWGFDCGVTVTGSYSGLPMCDSGSSGFYLFIRLGSLSSNRGGVWVGTFQPTYGAVPRVPSATVIP